MNLPLVEELSPCPDPADALAAFADQLGLLLLDSALVREPTGRYSFLAADPFETFVVDRATLGRDPFESIARRLRAFETEAIAGLPPFQGGAAGLFSYELGGAFEKIPRARHDEFQLPDLAVGLYDWVIAWDHREHRAWIISQGYPATSPADREQRARQRLEFGRGRLAASRSSPAPFSTAPLPASALAPQFPAPGLEGLTSNFSRDAYMRAVERTIEWIYAGDIFQANLSQRLLYP
ncbi:MAG TPA: aminodeoxychorismate synthase, component I, partial [Planctomycetaceae bacterium]|nr:aminodeoxychorismate synthase, component I [Planctomycetaceae bacterium]